MYTHEVLSLGPLTVMSHYRETSRESGLISVQELGRTVALDNSPTDTRRASGLIMADELDVMSIDASRTDSASGQANQAEQIRCEDLEEFVRLGVMRWKELMQHLGAVTKITTELAEKHEVVENKTETGLIIADEQPESSFGGYIARPDEIEAIERLANSIPLPAENDDSIAQLYL